MPNTKRATPSYRCMYAAVCFALLASGAANAADWSVTLDEAVQSGLPGSPIIFSGTVTNSTGADLFLNTGAINFSSSAPFTKDYADDFLNLLGIIPAGGYSGALFDIQWLAGALPGDSGTGTFVLTVGAPTSPASITTSFQASVSNTTPEPASISLIAYGSILLTAFLGRSIRMTR